MWGPQLLLLQVFIVSPSMVGHNHKFSDCGLLLLLKQKLADLKKEVVGQHDQEQGRSLWSFCANRLICKPVSKYYGPIVHKRPGHRNVDYGQLIPTWFRVDQ